MSTCHHYVIIKETTLHYYIRGQWSGYRNLFWQCRLLTVTVWPCSLSFKVQVMILVGSSVFFNHTSASLDGCCLYIIIHYGILWWDWWRGLVLRGGRPETESYKVIDTYSCSKIIPIVPTYVPGYNKIVHIRDGSAFLNVNEWTGSLVLLIYL